MAKDLEQDAQEWKPDAGPEASKETGAEGVLIETAPLSETGGVTLIEDPYGFRALEVSEQQGVDDALELDGDLETKLAEETGADDCDEPELELPSEEATALELSQLAEAINSRAAEDAAEMQELVGEPPEDAAKRLAEQIAEDEALSAALAQEAEESARLDPELAAALPQNALDIAEIQSCLEALLFMCDRPMKLEKLQEMLGPDFPFSAFQEAITVLKARYQGAAHGIELVEVAGGFQFRTKPGRAALARKLAKVQTQRLSTGAMETLAIVAYRQPVMKEEIDKIRGVDSSHFIRGLLEKKLIAITGRSELPGRPMLYSTTEEFLQVFGLKDLAAMPSLRELEQMIPASQAKPGEEDDPRIKEMRKLVSDMKASAESILHYDPKEDEKILKDIRDRVGQIPTTTPTLEAQLAAEKAQAELAKQQAAGIQPQADALGQMVLQAEAQPVELSSPPDEMPLEALAPQAGALTEQAAETPSQ